MTTPRGTLRPDDRRRGIVLMLATFALFACMDATVKYLTRDYSVPQIVWARFATLAGGAIVIASGFYIFRGEATAARSGQG